MITPIATPWEPNLWRTELRHAIRTGRELLERVELPSHPILPEPDFPVMVPRGFAARIQPGNPDDPILKQVLAVPDEQQSVVGFVNDPLAETQSGVSKAPTLLQKYQHRALLITTSACAVNCRYCFRRHFPYAEHRPNVAPQALAAVSSNTDLTEIILSGGDPLLLDDGSLAKLCNALAAMTHLKRLRIHTRIPVVLPERMTSRLLCILQYNRLPVVLVIHANHANELDASTARAFALLKSAGVTLLNQSVLLLGVNDTVEAQCHLAERLFEQGVLPYYLHMPDKVAGTHHFFVSDAQAAKIHHAMRAALPGYLVPKLVREVPGEVAKMPLVF